MAALRGAVARLRDPEPADRLGHIDREPRQVADEERLTVVPPFIAKHSSTAARQFENIPASVASVSKDGIWQTAWSSPAQILRFRWLKPQFCIRPLEKAVSSPSIGEAEALAHPGDLGSR